MKKNLFLVAAVALAAVVSCNKEGLGDNDGAQTPSSVVFTAGVETKTTLVDNGDKTYSINWISGDAISVDGVTFTTTDSGAKAFFLTEDVFTEDNDYEAIYPAIAGKSFASVTVPQSQEATAGNFCSSAAVSVAKSNTTSLDFKNLTSFLKFQVPANANTVTISSIDDLAGEVTVNYNNGEPTWTAKNTVKTIKVTCSGGFKKGQDYYVSVLPGVKKNFEVRIDDYLSKNKESVEPKRSTVMKMGVLPEPKVRLYVKSEKTVFDMKIYAWGIDGVSLPSSWPGESMTWDEEKSMYYYDFPYGIKDKKMSYIVNNGVIQTPDLDATISSPEYEDTKNVKWHWIYFKPSNNWKEGNAWFAAWFNNDGGDEYWMKSIGPDEKGVYGFVQPTTTFTKVEFERMNPASNDMKWSNKWNSTDNLTIPTDEKNYFQCTEGWWNSHNGPWTKYTLPN